MLSKATLIHMMEKGLNGRPTECTIRGRCRTQVFEFPGAFLQAEIDVEPFTIGEREQCKATLVSDLESYFSET